MNDDIPQCGDPFERDDRVGDLSFPKLSDSCSQLQTHLRSETMTSPKGEPPMINGVHVVLYSNDPEADRVFFRDVLKLPNVDAGHGWLIFALPHAEAAFHDRDEGDNKQIARHELFLMCDDIAATSRDLRSQHMSVSAVSEQRWGSLATLTLPGGSKLGIYQPKHPRPNH
jgi:hypothetical protein